MSQKSLIQGKKQETFLFYVSKFNNIKKNFYYEGMFNRSGNRKMQDKVEQNKLKKSKENRFGKS